MSDKTGKKKIIADQEKVIDEMALPPGEYLVPLKTGLNPNTTWIKKLKNKTR